MKRTLLAVIPLACMSIASTSSHAKAEGVKSNSFSNVDTTSSSSTNTSYDFEPVKPNYQTRFDNVDTTSSNSTDQSEIYAFDDVKPVARSRPNFDGAHFGSEIGVIDSKATVDTTYPNNRERDSNQDFAGNVSVGIGKSFKNKIYMGSELSLDFSNSQNDTTDTVYNTIERIDEGGIRTQIRSDFNTTNTVKWNSVGVNVDFKPGFVFNSNMLAYALVGAAFYKVNIDSSNTLTINERTINHLDASEHKNLTGLNLGLGVNQFLSKHLAAKIEYVYSQFPTVHGLTNDASVKINRQTLMIGLDYYFQSNR